MKAIITVVTFLICGYLGFLADSVIVGFILERVPETEWYGLIEIGVWGLILVLTFGLILSISVAISALVFALFDR